MELGGSELLAGVGGANNASNVGNATNVIGVAGSNTQKKNCGFHVFADVIYMVSTAENKLNGRLASRAIESWPRG